MAGFLPLSSYLETNSSEDEMALQRYRELVSTWPVSDASADVWPAMRRHKDAWYAPDWVMVGAMATQNHFVARPTNVLLASSLKCGTTWMKALLFTILHRQDDTAATVLRSHNPHECVPTLEIQVYSKHIPNLDNIPSPQVFHTHIPFCSLPPAIEVSGCRIVYVWRDPKDVAVSWWYFLNNNGTKAEDETVAIDAVVERFIQGSCPFGPYWDHVLGYWNYSLKNPGRMLFLSYEDILEDPVVNVRKLAEFMGKCFSPEEEKEGVPQSIVHICSLNSLKKMQVNKKGNTTSFGNAVILNASFFRNGRKGDWVAHLTPEMARRIDNVTKEKFGALRFPMRGKVQE